MSLTARTLILLCVLLLCAMPWIVAAWQQHQARRRWRRKAETGRTTRQLIQEIEERDQQQEARRGSITWPGRVRRRLEK